MSNPLDDKAKKPEKSLQDKTVTVQPADDEAATGMDRMIEALSPTHEKHAKKAKQDKGSEKSPEVAPEPAQAEPAAKAEPGKDLSAGGAIGAYSPEATRPLITRQAFEEKGKGAWMEDPKSRLAIRMFSRGVLGAAFFTAGGSLAKKWMAGYDPSKSFSQQSNKNPLSFIAKLVDNTAGKAIESTVTAVAGREMGLRSVRFRPTHFGRMPDGPLKHPVRGRSLGDEVVNITFDFFCASVGDAWGRDIAGWFDPNAKKNWIDDKGNINFPDAIKTAVKSVTRYITYNGGEDWAVAIPYAYFMKGQRSLINKMSPGFKYDFDRSINGGSFKLKDNKIVGNYNLEGIVDLQNRFTVYNIGTLMYREAYDYVGNMIAGKPHKIYGAPDGVPDEKRGVVNIAGDLVKWAARSAVKGAVIMTPAVPFFWITRTPQSKHRGAFIDPDKGILGVERIHDAIQANEYVRGGEAMEYLQHRNKAWPGKEGRYYDSYPGISAGITSDQFEPLLTQRTGTGQNKTAFSAYYKSHGILDQGLNAIGKANYKAANMLDKPATWMDSHFGEPGNVLKSAIGIQGRKFENFTRPFVYASASYTPYMYAKAEFANLWDNGKMDMAAERMIDGATKLNWVEFKSGLGEVWNTILYKPLSDPEREKEGNRRNQIDTSPPDVFLKTRVQQEREKLQRKAEAAKSSSPAKIAELAKAAHPAEGISWQERIVAAPKEKEEEAVAKADAGKPESAKQQKSHAGQEAMRKALEELKPPTNSIN